jgi:hypothetical protein
MPIRYGFLGVLVNIKELQLCQQNPKSAIFPLD